MKQIFINLVNLFIILFIINILILICCNTYNNTLNYNNLKNDFVVLGSRPTVSGSSEIIGCRFHLAIDKKPELNEHFIALYKDSFETVHGVDYNKEKHLPAEETFLFPDAINNRKRKNI